MIYPNRIKIQQISNKNLNQPITICGWIRTLRAQKTFAFIEVNDGSTLSGLQVIADESVPDYQELLSKLTTGSSIAIEGTLVESQGKNQKWEVRAEKITLIGSCPTENYPLQKKRHSFEFLRSIAHLRPRTNTQGAVTRVRNALAYATHKFFQERNFLYVHTPIITCADAEGGGQQFTVTTLDLEKVAQKQTELDFSQDFFNRRAFLTVSGQLNGEVYACALSDIYTFGPTFRAENSHTSRHLSEFWMIEPEIAFADLEDDMKLAQDYLQYVLRHLLENCAEDIAFFDRLISKGLLERLNHVVNSPFEHITYTKAIELLQKAERKFEYPVQWGCDLQSEHERYLCEDLFKQPVIISDYPKGIKAFYMRANDDQKTVAAMDVLVPQIGEIIGGSQREERLDMLEQKIIEHNLDPEEYSWYTDLRRYGSVPHAGFGVGFERLILFATGMENIRDVIPFPRYPNHAEF